MSTYPAATLNFLSSKRKWYVYVTVPPELREAFPGQTQIRRSTGTGDKREAQKLLHGIATEIYAAFDSKKPNPILAKMNELEALVARQGDAEWHLYQLLKRDAEQSEDAATDALTMLKGFAQDAREEDLIPYDDGGVVVHYDVSRAKKHKLVEEISGALTVSGDTNLLFWTVAKDYLQDTSFNSKTMKKSVSKALEEFSTFLGEKEISLVTSKIVYDWEGSLSKISGYARTTIRMRISNLSSLMNYAVRKGYLASNPAHGLKLTQGKEKESYIPFSKDELHKIFKLPMSPRERLLFSIAVTTGMRIDEIALLSWDNIKEEDGITYFDLTTDGYKVKNKGSARKVPLHPSVSLPERVTGRLFDYRLNRDGKTSTASAICSELIRQVTTDERKVFHSFRHTIKDLMRDAGVPKDTQDYITGHSSGDVAGRYGQGPSLKTRYEAIASVAHPWL